MQTVVFSKVFKEEGVSPKGRPWVRWDYKTEDGGRFPHFAATQEIPLDTAVNVQTSAKGDVKAWHLAGTPGPADLQQVQNGTSGASEAVRTAPVASQGPSERELERQTQIHRQTATKVAAKLLDFFPKAEQDLDTFWVVTEQLVDYYQDGVA